MPTSFLFFLDWVKSKSKEQRDPSFNLIVKPFFSSINVFPETIEKSILFFFVLSYIYKFNFIPSICIFWIAKFSFTKSIQLVSDTSSKNLILFKIVSRIFFDLSTPLAQKSWGIFTSLRLYPRVGSFPSNLAPTDSGSDCRPHSSDSAAYNTNDIITRFVTVRRWFQMHF